MLPLPSRFLFGYPCVIPEKYRFRLCIKICFLLFLFEGHHFVVFWVPYSSISMAPPPPTTLVFFIARRTIMMASFRDRSVSSRNCCAPPRSTSVAVFVFGPQKSEAEDWCWDFAIVGGKVIFRMPSNTGNVMKIVSHWSKRNED